jgi:16S rRNA (cytosine967-C5)-methyltransferase
VGTGRSRARSSADRRRPRPPAKPPPTPGARVVALRVLRRVTEEGAYSTIALSAELDRSRLAPRDRHLAAELVYGTLRRTIPLDHAIERVATRSIRRIDRPALAVLRLGAYQLLYSRIPDHAAVSATVDLAGPRERGFVNAVLRKLSTDRPPIPTGDDDRAISLRTGLTEWAVTELRRVLPADEVERAASVLAAPADLSLRVNTCRITADQLQERLVADGHEVRPGTHHPDVLLVPAAAPGALPGYGEGWFIVQDEASALVAAALDPRPGERLLDACAGPGGKATDLACRVGDPGLVIGSDVRLGRATLVKRQAERLGARVHVLVQDAQRPALEGSFDGVLVDAPCSGFGAARRRPELLWRPAHENLAKLARLQVAILSGAADLVRPGGRLVYSLCTFPRAETDAAVRAFLSKREDFEPAPVPGPGGSATPPFSHRLWPHVDGTDGMFYSGFRRRA